MEEHLDTQFLPDALPVTKEGKANHVFWVGEGDTPQMLERKGRCPVYSHLSQDTLDQSDGPLPRWLRHARQMPAATPHTENSNQLPLLGVGFLQGDLLGAVGPASQQVFCLREERDTSLGHPNPESSVPSLLPLT